MQLIAELGLSIISLNCYNMERFYAYLSVWWWIKVYRVTTPCQPKGVVTGDYEYNSKNITVKKENLEIKPIPTRLASVVQAV